MNKYDLIIEELLSGWDIRQNVYAVRDSGKITEDFKQYLYDCVYKKRKSPFKQSNLEYLSIVIEQTEFTPPKVPEIIRDIYLAKINNALTPPNIYEKLETMLFELKEDELLNKEFIEFFRHCLDKSGLSPLLQQTYLELCNEKFDE